MYETYLRALLEPLGVYDLAEGTINHAELAALESRMEGYCYEQTGMGLKEYSAQFMTEEPEQAGMQGPQM